MTEMTMVEAIRSALTYALEEDPEKILAQAGKRVLQRRCSRRDRNCRRIGDAPKPKRSRRLFSM